jgi:hypothetical protein
MDHFGRITSAPILFMMNNRSIAGPGFLGKPAAPPGGKNHPRSKEDGRFFSLVPEGGGQDRGLFTAHLQ